MIIKRADARTHDIEVLKRIKGLSHISRDQARLVEKELIALRSGLKGEREAAYHIDFHYGSGQNYAILHDLRLEYEGRVAQIDHLIIGRMLQVFLCETKYWSDGIAINDQGEFSAHYGRKIIGVPSPIMQNARHMKVLSDLLASDKISRPKRFGMMLPFTINPITLVSTGANIQRPEGLGADKYSEVIKSDQLDAYIQMHSVSNMSAFAVGKLVSRHTLRNFAESLSALHTPIKIDYRAKFGIDPAEAFSENSSGPSMSFQVSLSSGLKNGNASEEKETSPKQYFCAICKGEVDLKVARFCWFNKERFDSQIRCRAHQ